MPELNVFLKDLTSYVSFLFKCEFTLLQFWCFTSNLWYTDHVQIATNSAQSGTSFLRNSCKYCSTNFELVSILIFFIYIVPCFYYQFFEIHSISENRYRADSTFLAQNWSANCVEKEININQINRMLSDSIN